MQDRVRRIVAGATSNKWFRSGRSIMVAAMMIGSGMSACSEECVTCHLIRGLPARDLFDVSVVVPPPPLTVADDITVRVIVRNKSGSTATVPTQHCIEPIEIVVGGAGYSAVKFCDGHSYPGAVLSQGDSIVFTRKLMPIISAALGTTDPGTYCMRGLVQGRNGTAYGGGACVDLLPP